MNKRKYKVKFRITIGDENSHQDANFLKYYMPKWSKFMGKIMSRKLTSVPTNNTSSVKELPFLRPLITKEVKTVNIIKFLTEKDSNLARLLLEVAPLFDAAPRDLKAHILAGFGVTHTELKEVLEHY